MKTKALDNLERAIEVVSPDYKYGQARTAIEIRKRIEEECEAINSYLSLIPHLTDKRIINIIVDIANEEKVHVGELQAILYKLDPTELEKEKEGREENA